MKLSGGLWMMSMLLCAASAHAQLYKWVGPDGKVNYTDTPPPTSAKQVEKKPGAAGNVADTDLPYELAQAVRNSPVALYTTRNCAPCEDGRKLLNARGIPYAEKTINSSEDIAELRKLAGDTQLPLLFIGRSKEQGFQSDSWNRALSSAGYPESNKLPSTYRRSQAEPLVPPRTATAGAPQDSQSDRSGAAGLQGNSELPPPTGNAPPGFRF